MFSGLPARCNRPTRTIRYGKSGENVGRELFIVGKAERSWGFRGRPACRQTGP